MPLYLNLLPYILDEYSSDLFYIPFILMIKNLALIVACLSIGFLVSWWKPIFSTKAAKCASPFAILLFIVMIILNFTKYMAGGIFTKNTLLVMLASGPMGAAISYLITVRAEKQNVFITRSPGQPCTRCF